MTITVNLVGDELPVLVDDRTAGLGGSFYFSPLRPYSPAPLAWVWEQLKRYPRATLIDVGASTGCYSLLACHHPGLNVYAFEPVPLTCSVLRANVRLNGLENRVKVFGKAVSNYNGVGVLHAVKDDGGKGVSIVDGTPAYHKDCEQSRVNAVTLDSICKRHNIAPTVIKADTEGSEKYVLEGARETIEKYRPFLLFETSVENANQFGYNPSDCIAMLERWNYTWSNPESTDIWAVPVGWESIMERCM
jgi:FkbM family methyltransferase